MKQVIKAAEELFTASPQFKLLADAMPQIVWLADENGITYYYNAKWYELMGHEEGHDKEPYFYSHVLHPEDSEKAKLIWKECVLNKTEFNLEYRFLDKKNERYKWVLARALPVLDESGRVTWYGTYTDIDEQKKNQDRLAESLRFRDEFLSIVGHELKTPLTSLKLQIQLGLKKLKSPETITPESQQKVLSTCLGQANRLASLVDDLLDITHIQKGKFGFNFADTNVSEVIKNITHEVSPQLQAIGSQVLLDIPDNLVGRIDSRRIEQVLLNLYMNSAKYAAGTPIKISASEEDNNLKILFQDSGKGISQEVQGRIFDRFERGVVAKNISGLGLGLYIVKKIIEGHNGDIKLISRPGEGAAFEISLPVT